MLSYPQRKLVRQITARQVRKLQRGAVRARKYDPCPCGSGDKSKWCCWGGGGRRGPAKKPGANK